MRNRNKLIEAFYELLIAGMFFFMGMVSLSHWQPWQYPNDGSLWLRWLLYITISSLCLAGVLGWGRSSLRSLKRWTPRRRLMKPATNWNNDWDMDKILRRQTSTEGDMKFNREALLEAEVNDLARVLISGYELCKDGKQQSPEAMATRRRDNSEWLLSIETTASDIIKSHPDVAGTLFLLSGHGFDQNILPSLSPMNVALLPALPGALKGYMACAMLMSFKLGIFYENYRQKENESDKV